ncbi:MAG: DUF4325 domain-containing protein [Ferruginibacter sp.]|nr:DUF4325 domain-containing protein [Ferruginibacter sp.]
MTKISLFEYTGDFAENKDIAKSLRIEIIEHTIKKGGKITIDFNSVTSATQSFIHALISEVIRVFGIDVLDSILFKNCNKQVKTIISIVVEYVQDGIYTDPEE